MVMGGVRLPSTALIKTHDMKKQIDSTELDDARFQEILQSAVDNRLNEHRSNVSEQIKKAVILIALLLGLALVIFFS